MASAATSRHKTGCLMCVGLLTWLGKTCCASSTAPCPRPFAGPRAAYYAPRKHMCGTGFCPALCTGPRRARRNGRPPARDCRRHQGGGSRHHASGDLQPAESDARTHAAWADKLAAVICEDAAGTRRKDGLVVIAVLVSRLLYLQRVQLHRITYILAMKRANLRATSRGLVALSKFSNFTGTGSEAIY